MMNWDREIEYCLGREREERLAASASVNVAVHDAHFVMAERYADRADALGEQQYEAHIARRVLLRAMA